MKRTSVFRVLCGRCTRLSWLKSSKGKLAIHRTINTTDLTYSYKRWAERMGLWIRSLEIHHTDVHEELKVEYLRQKDPGEVVQTPG